MNAFFTIKNRTQEIQLFKRRLIVVIIGGVILLLALISRLTYLQLFKYHHFTTLSTNNEIAVEPIEPRRGIIYDRNGEILAKNTPVFSLMITPYKVKNLTDTINNIKEIIEVDDNDLEEFHKQYKQRRHFEQIPLKMKLTEKQVAIFEVNRYQFPGVAIKAQLMRAYPLGKAFAHVLGFVGRINGRELQNVDRANYAASNFIGKVGIEKHYEATLHGTVGYKKVEKDVSGAIVRTLKRTEPIQGENLYLTIDSKLQIAAEKALGDKAGSVVAIQPSTGQILALVSMPNYDPNLFVNGISHKAFNKLQANKKHPLFNRSIRGLYAPGSTIKPFIALEGLNSETITPDFKIFDPGWFKLPNTQHIFHDWSFKTGGHGWVNLNKALTESCDTYFYDLANKLGIDAIDKILQQFGLGESTGIDLDEELTGNNPSPQWKLKYRGTNWYKGDTVQAGIGQGYMLVTPLQLAAATSGLANRGKLFFSSLLLASQGPDKKIITVTSVEKHSIKLNKPLYWHVVLTAMKRVISKGTGRHFGRHAPYTVAGKTGTVQLYGRRDYSAKDNPNLPERLRNNSLFIAFAPYKNPEIAIAVIVEHNSDAPIVARKVIDYYLLSILKTDKSIQARKKNGAS